MLVNLLFAATLAAAIIAPKDLDINDAKSVRDVAGTLAFNTMSYYTGNVTKTVETLAVFPAPYYWWQSGACWGSMLDYSHYTGDRSYDEVIIEALLSQVGPNYDFMVPRHYGDEGNDDQAFWCFTVLAAAERNFPQPNTTIPAWLDLASNIWNAMVVRWDTSACNGGFRWQIFENNANGVDYKNSVSNGGFFQLSARLARATNNDTYVQWAQKVWDWSAGVGLIGDDYTIYDGVGNKQNCSQVNRLSFSYSQGIYLYGAAVLYNYTNGDKVWGDRATNLLRATDSFFSPYDNSTSVMWEHACEEVGTCNVDMKSFKAYLARFMWATTLMMPSTLPEIQKTLSVSAAAAGKACSGGTNGTLCGQKWYTDGYDGNTGLGQQMSALEVVQGLLAQQAAPPLRAGEIKRVTSSVPIPTQTSSLTVPSTTQRPAQSSTNAAVWRGENVVRAPLIGGALAWGILSLL